MTAMEANTVHQHDTRRWRDFAACRSVDPEWFFPTAEPGSPRYDAEVAQARTVCGRCPVRAACLWAAASEPWGISGGLTEHERQALRQDGDTVTPVDPAARAAERAARVAAEGLPVGAGRAEVRQVGLALLAGGVAARDVAGRLRVSRRSVQRWVADGAAA